jgi:hypothetical protein
MTTPPDNPEHTPVGFFDGIKRSRLNPRTSGGGRKK